MYSGIAVGHYILCGLLHHLCTPDTNTLPRLVDLVVLHSGPVTESSRTGPVLNRVSRFQILCVAPYELQYILGLLEYYFHFWDSANPAWIRTLKLCVFARMTTLRRQTLRFRGIADFLIYTEASTNSVTTWDFIQRKKSTRSQFLEFALAQNFLFSSGNHNSYFGFRESSLFTFRKTYRKIRSEHKPEFTFSFFAVETVRRIIVNCIPYSTETFSLVYRRNILTVQCL